MKKGKEKIMGKQLVVYFDPSLPANKTFFKNILASRLGVMSAILSPSKSVYRLNFSGPTLQIIRDPVERPKVDHVIVAEALGADLVGNLNMIDSVNWAIMTISLISGTSFAQEKTQLIFRNDDLVLILRRELILKVIEADTDVENILWERK